MNHSEFRAGAVNSDLRGQHVKYYGNNPEKVRYEGFDVHEVFLTVSHRNVVRGLHFQVNPAQPKILTCVHGSAKVAVVCLVPNDRNFGKVVISEVLTPAEAGESETKMIHVPAQHALGYRVLEDNTKMLYIAGADFSGPGDVGIDPFDSELNVDWSISGETFTREDAILSPRDEDLPSFEDYVKGLEK